MSSSITSSAKGYPDPMMASLACGELLAVRLGSKELPTTPQDWLKAMHKIARTDAPDSMYAHAIAAGHLVPTGDEMHLSPEMGKWLSAAARKVAAL